MPENSPQLLRSIYDSQSNPGDTILTFFDKNCADFPDKNIYYYLEDGYEETAKITFREMQIKAKSIAFALQASCKKGDRALMLFPSGIDFIVSLFGCFYAGVIGVPAYPPRKNRLFERFEAIVNDCRPRLIFTTHKIREDIRKNFSDEKCLQGVDLLVFEEIEAENEFLFKDPGISPDDLALLQYTSGSTGAPNGVMLSHFNVLVNSELISRAYGHNHETIGVNWLPGFHDMGLIGALLQPPFVGCTNVIMPPNAFLLRPMNWLKSISKYKANTAGGPNFALDYCVERFKPDELGEANLSTVKPFFCGAEPIRKETLERFTETFAPYKFTPSQLYPCYGLAESVLMVTGGKLDEEPVYIHLDSRELEKGRIVPVESNQQSVKTIVSCGYPWLGTSVAIIDPETNMLQPPGMVGEIWISGPSVAQGYWNKPDETERTFNAFIKDTGEGPFLRSGDLGFIYKGNLYISGRIKDLIIIRGLNHYPTDIERSAEQAHEAFQPGAVAAFSVNSTDGEKLVVVGEVRRTFLRDLNADAVFEAVREAVSTNHQVQIHAIVIIKTSTLPKTSSGKIQRLATKKEYLQNELEVIAMWKAEINTSRVDQNQMTNDQRLTTIDSIQDWIIAWMVKELKISRKSIDIDKPITAFGLDSLKAVVLARDAEDYFGIEWPMEMFLEETTIRKIAEQGLKILSGENTNT